MQSVWELTSIWRKPRLTVVGAGIVGLFAALHHKRRFPGHEVLVLERGPFPMGASVRNAGFACFGSPSELLADIEAEGRDAALARVEERWRGLLELRRELGDALIGFEATGGHEIYRTGDRLYPRVAEGFDALNADLAPILGKAPFIMADERIARFGMRGIEHLVYTELEGPIDSGRMIQALYHKVVESGVTVRMNCDVAAFEESADEVRIRLTGGEVIRTGQVLMATNGYTRRLFPDLDVVPARGQVLITSAVPGLKLQGTFHMDEGFYYFRDLNGAILLGGGRNLDLKGEATDAEGTNPRIQAALESLLREVILPGEDFKVAMRWSGVMAFGTGTKDPLVQRLSDRIGVAVRMGGMGVAMGTRVAQRAVALMAE